MADHAFGPWLTTSVDQYADAHAKSAIAIALGDAFGLLNTPEARIRQGIREMRRRLDEFEQYVELVSR